MCQWWDIPPYSRTLSVTADRNRCLVCRWYNSCRYYSPVSSTVYITVEPLSNDHPHQRPSLSYDHISCDGQWFLFVYESLTSDHPSYTTTPMWFWGWSYKRGSTVLALSVLKVSLITLTNRAYSINKCFNSIIQSSYVQYQSNNVSDS